MSSIRVSYQNQEWHRLVREWSAECDEFEENFGEYATASLPVLDELASSAQTPAAGVFGYEEEGSFKAVYQANSSFLPGYVGKVLRIRHIVLAPKFDFSDEFDIDDYINVMIGVFAGAILLADGELMAQHVKFHLKSPAEREFGQKFIQAAGKQPVFAKAEMRGSWIYLSKA
ncbi:hypothetical protein [Sulfitobacter sp. 1A13679]|uniref:hypothetical protein n=1 Tax=Sulfitobacter sp. 1A13679 TaxID=3368597 RepID=UPI0037459424